MSTLAEALCFPLCGNARSPWFLTKALVKPVCHHLRLPRRQLDLREDPLPNFPASLWLPRSEGRRARPTREAAPPAGSRVTEQRTGVDGGDRKVLSVPLALRQRPRPGLTGKRKKKKTLAEICTLYPNQPLRPHAIPSSPQNAGGVCAHVWRYSEIAYSRSVSTDLPEVGKVISWSPSLLDF